MLLRRDRDNERTAIVRSPVIPKFAVALDDELDIERQPAPPAVSHEREDSTKAEVILAVLVRASECAVGHGQRGSVEVRPVGTGSIEVSHDAVGPSLEGK